MVTKWVDPNWHQAGHPSRATGLTGRLASGAKVDRWNSRGHFFAAAAEAMRRILVETARRKRAAKHGGCHDRHDLDEIALDADVPFEDLIALDEALTALAAEDPGKAEVVQLRYFAGLSVEEAARALDISVATAKRRWTYARAWLFRAIQGRDREPPA